MKMMPTTGRTLAVVLFGSGMLLAACGTDGNTMKLDRRAPLGAQALLQGGNDDDEEESTDEDEEEGGNDVCAEIKARLQKDGMALQRTKEFRALAKTPEFKQLQKDFEALQAADCSLTGNGASTPECNKLKLQAYKHQQALMRTPEFQKLSKTPEFKKVMKDFQEAQQNDCLDDMQSSFTFRAGDDAAAWMMLFPL